MSSFTLQISTSREPPPSTPVSSHTPTTPTVRAAADATSRLTESERFITDAVSNAVGIVQELAKEKAVLRNVEQSIGEFATNVTRAESALLEQIAYLQRFQGGHVFESSAYGALKDAEIAEERLQLVADLVKNLPTQSEENTSISLQPPSTGNRVGLPMDVSSPDTMFHQLSEQPAASGSVHPESR